MEQLLWGRGMWGWGLEGALSSHSLPSTPECPQESPVCIPHAVDAFPQCLPADASLVLEFCDPQ